ncbi:MAG: AEC family transporter [Pseudanabaenaceae cyanobacterium bins.68]|nr:AEC family transporter [Pseudanabaenaceae cyanobacterium bins.68]
MEVNLDSPLLRLYVTLISWVLLGFVLGKLLPKGTSKYLGNALFWFGVPLLIIASLRGRDLSGSIWVAPVTAWVAIAVGALFAWIWIDLGVSDERLKRLAKGVQVHDGQAASLNLDSAWSKSTQGSFLLAMMVGNTGYVGFPVILTLVGKDYFAWALLFDLLGSTLGAYGLGVAIAAHYGRSSTKAQKWWQPLARAMVRNPALWSLIIGLSGRNLPLPPFLEQSLTLASTPVIPASLIMIGMQLSQLSSLGKLRQSSVCLFIKMILVPLFVGTGLMFFGIEGAPRLAIVLQMSMPPAFATLVIAQAYNLDRDLSVTALAFGSIGLLFTLPIWVWLFS